MFDLLAIGLVTVFPLVAVLEEATGAGALAAVVGLAATCPVLSF
jgi:hypothetical protein